MFCKFFLVWMIAHRLWDLLVYYFAQLSYLPKYERPLFNRYVWDKIRPSNGCFVQNMAQKLKVFLNYLKILQNQFFLLNEIKI